MKLIAAILCAWVATAASVLATTVVGTAIPSTGTNYVTTVTCEPRSTPMLVGTNFIYGVTQTIHTDTNGFFSLTMVQGDYNVTIGGRDRKTISVPDTTNVLNFADLITTNGGYVFRTPGALVKVSSTDTDFGFLIDKLQAGSSITLTKLAGGSNEVLQVALDPSISAAIAAKVAIAGDTMTGPLTTTTLTAGAYRDQIGTIAYAGTNTLDFSTNTINVLTAAGDCVFQSSGLAAGNKVRLWLFAPTNDIALTWPAGWRWVGLLPTNMLANTVAQIDATSLSTNDANVVSEYREE